jgi:hypothetical protein
MAATGAQVIAASPTYWQRSLTQLCSSCLDDTDALQLMCQKQSVLDAQGRTRDDLYTPVVRLRQLGYAWPHQ